jgi:hypothetical protein
MPELVYKIKDDIRLVAGPDRFLLVTATVCLVATMSFKVPMGEFTWHVVHRLHATVHNIFRFCGDAE